MWGLLRQGGEVMCPLGLCSLLTLAIFLQRLVRLTPALKDSEPVATSITFRVKLRLVNT